MAIKNPADIGGDYWVDVHSVLFQSFKLTYGARTTFKAIYIDRVRLNQTN